MYVLLILVIHPCPEVTGLSNKDSGKMAVGRACATEDD